MLWGNREAIIICLKNKSSKSRISDFWGLICKLQIVILKSCENRKYGKWWWRILFPDAEEASAINKISNGRERIILFQAAIRKNCVNWTDRLNCNRSQGTRWCLSSDFEKVQSEGFFFTQLSGRGVKFFTRKWRDIKSVNNSPAAILNFDKSSKSRISRLFIFTNWFTRNIFENFLSGTRESPEILRHFLVINRVNQLFKNFW